MGDIVKIATRESYGNALAELGKVNPNVVVLDADLAGATKTSTFKKAFPDRHIDCGIAEANMTGIAAGLSTCGKIPIGYPHLNVKIGATHAGITVGEDGASHQCLEDIALMRTIPGMTVIVPSDDIEAKAAVFAAAETEGPFYMRFGRAAVPVINDNPDYKFEVGKAVVLKDGTDMVIFACGVCVAEALGAAEKLAADGINAAVVNIHTIKPIDKDTVLEFAKKTNRVFTVEEHSVIGGMGSAVCDVLAEEYPVKVTKIGVYDRFGKSGPAGALMKEFQLDAEGIYNQIKAKI